MIRTSLLARGVVLAALAAALGGCKTAEDVTGSTYPSDYRERFPIVLEKDARILDLFPEGRAGLDGRQRTDLSAFLAEYRRYGEGGLTVQSPAGTSDSGATRETVAIVRSAVGGRAFMSRYRPADPTMASPVRLTFRRLQAKVTAQCGLWPQDLGVADIQFSASNQPYWNHGCAYQSNLAAQVADPVDLVRGRQETPPDTTKRMRTFDQLRQGGDPSTTYKQDGQNKINQSF